MAHFRANRMMSQRSPDNSDTDVPSSMDPDHEDYLGDQKDRSDVGLNQFLHEVLGTSAAEVTNGEGVLPSLEFIKQNFKTKSAAIRYLYTQGIEVKVIAKHLNVRYQHVRNVLTTELKRGPNEPFKLGEENQIAQVLLRVVDKSENET